MRRPRHAGGRLYRRTNHRSGEALSTWTMVYVVDGTEKRESTGTANFKAAQAVLRTRLAEVDAGTYAGPDCDRVTVGELLSGLLDFYTVQGHRSLPSVTAQVKAIRTAFEGCRARDLTTARVRRVTKRWQEHVTNSTVNRRLGLLRRSYALGKLVLDPREARLQRPVPRRGQPARQAPRCCRLRRDPPPLTR